ncbi:MAG TPA: sortase [Candidatus Saccharimonadales bacterium]|nr:sortase [Candidatus Saccharimonadales bacterium]
MSTNPLFPQPEGQSDTKTDAAVELIRAKVSRAYADEPDAAEELAETQAGKALSKHQQYIQNLSASGKSLAEIQTEWHHYYTTLNDQEKHEVWQEFYAANQHTPYQKLFQKQEAARAASQQPDMEQPTPAIRSFSQPVASPSGVVISNHGERVILPPGQLAPKAPPKGLQAAKRIGDSESARKIKRKVADRVSANGKLQLKHHVQSIAFGLASGFVVLVVLLFTFLNQYIIAPFIQPSRNVSSTPIILSDSTVAADAPPSVTVPKINIQIPVNFSVATTEETSVQDGLKGGVVHYPTTVMPGQNGNAAFFGHSSGNIFNNGKYKFAFTLLHDLSTGDLFYITYGGKTYAYRIFDRQIVPPTDVGVINDTRGHSATAELITCDPPGISTNRLVVWGEQISPSPGGNTAAPAGTTAVVGPTQLVGNGPSLWSQMINTLEFWK